MKTKRKGVALAVAAGVVVALGGGVGVAVATDTTDSGSSVSCADQMGHQGTMHGGFMGQGAAITAAADYLGLSENDLHAQLQAGKSLADVAKAQGKSVSGLENSIVAAVKANLDSNTTLTADQKASMLAQVKEHVDEMVSATHTAGSGPMGHGMGMGGMRQ
ncbi:hypothetical protein ACF09G_03695 [Streptomyces albogriseolus]|uniref:Secreted protein n=3 Tax=unclassified Streptomyces TaxID=2593676 RepID=V9Z5U8_9ACTN|nr:hypothetical protein [Streptomyces sp. F2]AHE38873.1 Hypothetical protein pFRL3_96 [Streptomyces sp. FR1]AHE39354.1 Hypothetical protein pFRL4_121 [Streptomyces sp. F2]